MLAETGGGNTETTGFTQMLEGLIPWLNEHLPLDRTKPVSTRDIAFVTLAARDFEQIPAPTESSPWRAGRHKNFMGLQFRECPFELPQLDDLDGFRARIAWRLTAASAPLFKHY